MSASALSIKSDEADRLARELAAETGESSTDAVVTALRERLGRQRDLRGPSIRERIHKLQVEIAALPRIDDRTDEAIIGYEEHGLPT
ncbi:type II toxin-antitoxin system VapB family antitoxin [Actinomycetes bacterium KLBMP 9759]